MAKRGARVPALEDRPELAAHMLPFLDCWNDLGGMITWHAVKEWATHYRLNFETMYAVLSGADARVRKWQREQLALNRPNPKRSAKAR